MKINGPTPNQGPDGRRIPTAKSPAPKEGERSFGAILKKATASNPAPTAPAPAPAAPVPAPAPPAASATTPSAPLAKPDQKGKTSSDPGSFADHIEMIKLRLKSGYYNNQSVDDALSEKLTGYFDDLA